VTSSTEAARIVVPAVAAGSLMVGFGVAQATGVRWIGGLILLAGGAYCAAVMLPRHGFIRTAIVAVVYVSAFVLSHPLGKVVGTWPAVVLVTAVTAAVAYVAMRPTGSRVSTTESPERSTR
jgi:predicted membrane-bound spermidine synthase